MKRNSTLMNSNKFQKGRLRNIKKILRSNLNKLKPYTKSKKRRKKRKIKSSSLTRN